METLLLIVLILMDILLFGYVYFSNRTKGTGSSLIDEMREERRIIDELRAGLKDQIAAAEDRIVKLQEKVVAMASEAEYEHEGTKKLLTENTEDLLAQMEKKLAEPLDEINERCDRAHRFLDKVNQQRQGLLKALAKAETITKFFNKELPYNELLEEIEDKKYLDARHMLSRGRKPEDVASELNMPVSEVRLLLSLG